MLLHLSGELYFWLWQIQGPFWAWALVSALLGLGFTFFSGATEAWLVDALNFSSFKGALDSVFAKGQSVAGAAMLIGSVTGGLVAQFTNLGVPYLLRALILLATMIIALTLMKDWGFIPSRGLSPIQQVRSVLAASIENGWRRPAVRWMMLASPFTVGVSFYVFYAMQPYLLQLYGNQEAYGIAGLAAAIIAGAQIVGGLSVNYIRRLFHKRTAVLITASGISLLAIGLLGIIQNFWVAITLLVVWGLVFSMIMPVRQAYLNGLIESRQRATVLSFDALMGSSGGVVTQPALGRAADAFGYAPSYLLSAAFQAGALPFLIAARKQQAASDKVQSAGEN